MARDRNKAGMIREDFTVVFEVHKIGSIKGWKEGEHNKNFVKFRGVNEENVVDKDIGFRELETIIDFTVEVPTMSDVVLLKEKFYDMRDNGQTVKFRGGLPKKDGYDEILKIKNIDTYEGFLKMNRIDLKKDEDKTK